MIDQCNIDTIFLGVILPYLEELKLDKSSFVRPARRRAPRSERVWLISSRNYRFARAAAPDRQTGVSVPAWQAGGAGSGEDELVALTWKPT